MGESRLVDAALERAVSRGLVPGVAAIAVDRRGVVYEGAFGHRRLNPAVPMSPDTMFQIHSMTKAITSLAAVQLIAQGRLHLDLPAEDVLPQLVGRPVLTDDGTLRPAARPITLRHLLTHTSGFSSAFTSQRMTEYLREHPDVSVEDSPLLCDPGERWQYGVSSDWAGRMVEAASGLSLDVYFDRHIFGPLGMTDTTFALSDEQSGRLVSAHRRLADGTLVEDVAASPPRTARGAGGLCSTARDFAHFLQFMLTDVTPTGERLLDRATTEAFITSQTGALRVGTWKTADPPYSNDVDFSDGGTAGWTLGFLCAGRDMPGGHSAGTLSWAGIRNTYYWIDRRAGLAGAVFMQILPFADRTCLGVFADFERAVYAVYAR